MTEINTQAKHNGAERKKKRVREEVERAAGYLYRRHRRADFISF